MRRWVAFLPFVEVVALVIVIFFVPLVPSSYSVSTGVDTSVSVPYVSLSYYLVGVGTVAVHHCSDACIISSWSWEYISSPLSPTLSMS